MEDQQEGEEENKDILHKVIESWKEHFWYALNFSLCLPVYVSTYHFIGSGIKDYMRRCYLQLVTKMNYYNKVWFIFY